MITVFALTLIFADGYLGGSTHARDFKSMALCNKNGAQMAMQYTSWGHPASFVCGQIEVSKIKPKVTVITHDWKSLAEQPATPTTP